jgi:hypothetical protein
MELLKGVVFMKIKFFNILLKYLFYPSPPFKISDEEIKLFDNLYEKLITSPGRILQYNLPIPKYKFLQYISHNKPIVLHGSNNININSFEPRDQTLFNGKMTQAVFATKESTWSIFFAIFNKESIVSNFRNGCITANGCQKYHFYSLTGQTFSKEPWINGMVYLLPEKSFIPISKGSIQFDEWISKEPVIPIAKIEVEPQDFYFLDKVACHKANESIAKSWTLYKFRTIYKNNKGE